MSRACLSRDHDKCFIMKALGSYRLGLYTLLRPYTACQMYKWPAVDMCTCARRPSLASSAARITSRLTKLVFKSTNQRRHLPVRPHSSCIVASCMQLKEKLLCTECLPLPSSSPQSQAIQLRATMICMPASDLCCRI